MYATSSVVYASEAMEEVVVGRDEAVVVVVNGNVVEVRSLADETSTTVDDTVPEVSSACLLSRRACWPFFSSSKVSPTRSPISRTATQARRAIRIETKTGHFVQNGA